MSSRRFPKQESGQSLIEYVLVILFIVGIFSTIQTFTLKGVGKLWRGLAKEIAAACPKCTPPDELTSN